MRPWLNRRRWETLSLRGLRPSRLSNAGEMQDHELARVLVAAAHGLPLMATLIEMRLEPRPYP